MTRKLQDAKLEINTFLSAVDNCDIEEADDSKGDGNDSRSYSEYPLYLPFPNLASRQFILANIISVLDTIGLVNLYKVHLDVGANGMQVSLHILYCSSTPIVHQAVGQRPISPRHRILAFYKSLRKCSWMDTAYKFFRGPHAQLGI